MRVYLGSDHAGYELKNHLVEWLGAHGHEAVDCGPHIYDAQDDYPPFCLRAAEKTAADPDSLGIVIGGSGNGEQIAANKVKGVRAALAWRSRPPPRPRAQQRQRRRDRRPDAHGGGVHQVGRVFLSTPYSNEERHTRRIEMLSAYENTGELPPVPARPPAGLTPLPPLACRRVPDPAARPCPPPYPRREQPAVPEGHTIHRLARAHAERFVGAQVRVSSPQGKFFDSAALLDGHALTTTDAHGKHLFLGFGDTGWVHIHLGLFGKLGFGAAPPPPPTDTVRLRLVNAAHHADLRGPTTCALITEPEKRAIHERLGPDPLRGDEGGERAWQRISRSRTTVAALLMDQKVIAGVGNVYRAEVLSATASTRTAPARTSPAPSGTRSGRTSWS
ncbi:DNA-(apurinic or apyrimidinic site) lyase OS=Streptomyces microflavus OX=1919 GN=Smic_24330 PE=3 SV=1 [Streptomyces microflavus]